MPANISDLIWISVSAALMPRGSAVKESAPLSSLSVVYTLTNPGIKDTLQEICWVIPTILLLCSSAVALVLHYTALSHTK